MAARRLIALLVVLLVVSSIAAALAPPPTERGETESSTTTSTVTEAETPGRPPASGGGEIVVATIELPAPERPEGSGGAEGSADRKKGEPDRPGIQTIEARAGDQLALTVRATDTIVVEIPDLGLLETAAAGAPARFDVLLREPGRLAVEADGRPAASIEIRGGRR